MTDGRFPNWWIPRDDRLIWELVPSRRELDAAKRERLLARIRAIPLKGSRTEKLAAEDMRQVILREIEAEGRE